MKKDREKSVIKSYGTYIYTKRNLILHYLIIEKQLVLSKY